MYLQMAKKLTEDAVRDKARDILGFKDKDGVRSGVGQITTFNQLGFIRTNLFLPQMMLTCCILNLI